MPSGVVDEPELGRSFGGVGSGWGDGAFVDFGFVEGLHELVVGAVA